MEPEPDSYISIFLLFVPLSGISLTVGIVAAIGLVLLLLFCSALISSSEVAFFSLTPNDVEKLKQDNTIASQRIFQLKETPRNLLATILICNNFINIAIVILSDFIFRQVLPQSITDSIATKLINWFSLDMDVNKLARNVDFSITVVGVTFLLVLFGEVAPKVYAKLNNIKLARMMSGPLMTLSGFFRPLSTLLIRGTSLIEKRLAKRSQNGSLTSKEDIDNAIELTVKDEIGAEQDIDILKGIV
ncbi:MAG: CNNM domain-containing protein, partial [Bacteroidota bacterium]